ncbi:hypothetical protein Tco_0904918 [Tanacetum coccineum]
MFVFFDNTPLQNTMAEQNVPNHPPTRTDEQIVPRSQWLSIGKSNLLFNAQKIQKNPVFQISVDILSNTNFFQAFTASANVPAIYLQQFVETNVIYEKTGLYSCQRKTSGSDKPRHPVLQMLWGIVTQSNASHKASLKNPKKKVSPLLIPYGRFSKVIIYYLASNNNIHRRPDSAVHHTGDDYVLGNLKFVPKGESVEVFGMAIPDPLITEAIQQSSYYPKYLEMVAENTKKTPQESASVQPATKRATPKKPTTTTPVKQSKPAPSPTKKPSKHDDPDLDLAKKLSLEAHQEKGEEEGNDADLERAIKLSLDPVFLPQGRAPVGGVTIRDPVSETTSKLHEVVGKGKAVVTEEQVAHSLIDLSKKKRTTDQFILVRRDQTPPDSTTGPSSQPEDDTSEKVIHESSSTSDSERTESETETAAPKGDKDQGEVDSSTVTSGVSIPVSDPEKAHEALAGPDPEPMKEDQTGSDSGKLHVSLAGPNPEHMDDEFLATAYPKVHENLKLITDERVIDDKPESHSGSMSSMKNLDDTFNFGDQFLHDKPTEDDQEKSKVREESDSTIPDSSHQTVTSTPPVIAPFTEVSSSEPSLLVTPPPINTEATTITTSLPEITPFIATPFIALQLRVAKLEQEMSEVKKTDLSADVLASIRSQVPTAVDTYLGTKLDDALLKVLNDHTADLIKKYFFALLHHMNKKKSAQQKHNQLLPSHTIALLEALNSDEDAMDKESGQKPMSTKRRRSDSAASGSAQPPQKMMTKVQRNQGNLMHLLPNNIQLSPQPDGKALTQEMLVLAIQCTDLIPNQNILNNHQMTFQSKIKRDGSVKEDTTIAHIPKVSTTTWFKPIPESERPATPEPEWTIPPNDFPEPEHNWANAYASTFKVPEENKLQRKTYDIGSFIKWFCRRTGKKKLCKADLEGPTFNLTKVFHKNSVFLQYQMDECHKLLTNKVYGNHSLCLGGRNSMSTKHSESSERESVQIAHGEFFSVVMSKWFEKYGYKRTSEEIILDRADLPRIQELRKRDFKNLHTKHDLKICFLLNIQEKLNHLPKTDKD